MLKIIYENVLLHIALIAKDNLQIYLAEFVSQIHVYKKCGISWEVRDDVRDKQKQVESRAEAA